MAQTPLLQRLDGLDARFEEIGTLITDPSVIADMKRYVKLSKEYKDLEVLLGTTKEYRRLLSDIDDARELLETESILRRSSLSVLPQSHAALSGR